MAFWFLYDLSLSLFLSLEPEGRWRNVFLSVGCGDYFDCRERELAFDGYIIREVG